MLPLYNFPTETGTSGASTSQFDSEEGLDNSDSGQNFDSSEGIDLSEVLSTSSSMRMAASVESLEHKPDILNSDFASHWQNLQFGRLCQNTQNPAPLIYPSPVMVPPVYLQGCFPWDGSGRPVSTNTNNFTQLSIVPVAPLQSASNRPAGVYQHYVDEMPRYRGGTGTYLPNPVRLLDQLYLLCFPCFFPPPFCACFFVSTVQLSLERGRELQPSFSCNIFYVLMFAWMLCTSLAMLS
jgi:hypothetical protein